MSKMSKYIFLSFIFFLLFLMNGCVNRYNRKSIREETRQYLNEIESGTYLSKQEVIFRNNSEIKIKELKLFISPKSTKQKDFDYKKFRFELNIVSENNIEETQEIKLKNSPGLDAYKFELSILDTRFCFDLVFCKNKIILYTKNHQNNSNLENGIFYNELAIFLDKVM